MKSTKSAAGVALVKNESVISENQQERLANPPVVEEIRQRAYEIYVGRGGTHGSDLDDWLQAERELKAKYNAS